MVHALAECCRVLRDDGRLIDLRPHAHGWPIEIVGQSTRILAGTLNDIYGTKDDRAADFAISEAVRKGWFEKEREEFFEYAYDWDTVEKMRLFVESEWDDLVTLPEDVLSEARRLENLASEQVQARIRRTTLIGSYRKRKPRG